MGKYLTSVQKALHLFQSHSNTGEITAHRMVLTCARSAVLVELADECVPGAGVQPSLVCPFYEGTACYHRVPEYSESHSPAELS